MTKTGFSRREFLQKSAGVAGASLAGLPILLEPEPLIAFPRLASPSDRVRFGIVGVGMEGTQLLTTAVQLPGVECVAACDLYDGRHELAREIVGKPIRTTRRYKELLDDQEIDAILVAVPDHWHKQVVVDAVGAGKGCIARSPCRTAPQMARPWSQPLRRRIASCRSVRNGPVPSCAPKRKSFTQAEPSVN